MANTSMARLGGRPVFIANYAVSPLVEEKQEQPAGRSSKPEIPVSQKAGIRNNFPAENSPNSEGDSDGYCLRITFAAGRLERTYEMILAFLEEQGYGDVPLPKDAAELKRFRLPPKLRHQLSLFGEDGYLHNPVKILFPTPSGRRGALLLELYNESYPDHLLRFHRRI